MAGNLTNYLENKLIDGIVKEPLGGAHTNPNQMYETLKSVLLKNLAELKKLPSDKLIEKRIEKFSAMGAYTEA